MPQLDSLNVSSNMLTSLEGLDACPNLSTLLATRNKLETIQALAPLANCPGLLTLDLQDNNLKDPAIIDVFVAMPQLRCL